MTSLAEVLVAEQEELSLKAYKDTRGLWTAGRGHLLRQDLDWTGITFSQSQCDTWFENDLGKAATTASLFPHYEGMDEVRQAVLISMVFQMGAAPLSWPRFTQALKDEDYARAADEGLDTLWHKQTPKRCELEMTMLRTGEWQT